MKYHYMHNSYLMVTGHNPKLKPCCIINETNTHLSCRASKELETENIVTDAGDPIVESNGKWHDNIYKDKRICYRIYIWTLKKLILHEFFLPVHFKLGAI
ncbi:hypothetical protein OIU78_018681 [Salix suchowensis]|nr:hypothetical protein OIU78_018681 [Salix suchowensis]